MTLPTFELVHYRTGEWPADGIRGDRVALFMDGLELQGVRRFTTTHDAAAAGIPEVTVTFLAASYDIRHEEES